MVWVDKTTLNVGEIGIADSNAHNILKRGITPGVSVKIESTVGVMTRIFDDPLTNFVIILTVGMFHDMQTPDNAVTAGYNAFQSALQDGIKSHLLALNSPDPSVVEQAQQQISDAVTAAVTSAISDSLSAIQKVEVATGLLTLDSTIGSASTSFPNLVNTNFTLTIGNPLGGRLFLYKDTTQNGTGDVKTPQVIGQGGWEQFKFLFAAGSNVIYAVNEQGQLLRYVDASQTGGGDVSSPQVVGQGGWEQFKFLFSGGGNIIYAVNQQEQLLRYVDKSQTGGGDVSSPQIVGQGGWLQFKFLFGGGNNVIYAVNQQGQLLRYVDASQTGGGDVSSPQVIGPGGMVGVPVSVHRLEQHYLRGQPAGPVALLQGRVADGRRRCQFAGDDRPGRMAAVQLPLRRRERRDLRCGEGAESAGQLRDRRLSDDHYFFNLNEADVIQKMNASSERYPDC
jgi:hypothetical protein